MMRSMGFFNRLLGAANKVDGARSDVEDAIFRDRRYDRAEDLAKQGGTIEATVTGIHFKFANDSTEGFYRVEWADPAPRAAGVRFPGVAPAAVRYGASVPIRVDGDKAVVDGATLAALTGGYSETGLSLRKVPEPGLSDTALNADVLRHLKKWPRERASVTSTEAVTFLGLGSQNWHITLTLVDGGQALVKRAYVPPYARWHVFPGAAVPVAVDPSDRTRAVIDWVELGTENAGGSWRDDPHEGSLVEQRTAPEHDVEAQAVMGAGAEIDTRPAFGTLDAIDGVSLDQVATIENWLIRDRVPPGEYDAYATERFEVAVGRYGAIKSEWDSRMRSDWRVAAAFGEEFERVRKELKKKR